MNGYRIINWEESFAAMNDVHGQGDFGCSDIIA